MNTPIHVLAISGSLKHTSSNTGLLRMMTSLVPGNVRMELYTNLENIPPFIPDKENDFVSVQDFRNKLKQADGIIICTPEYAFGVPGVLKNALDWVVSSGELNEKTVAVISASPLLSGGDKALNSLLLTLTALGTNTPQNITTSINHIYMKLQNDILDAETTYLLKNIIRDMLNLIHKNKSIDL